MSDTAPPTTPAPEPETQAPTYSVSTSCPGCAALSVRVDLQSETIDKFADALLAGGNLHVTGEYLLREALGRDHPKHLRNLFAGPDAVEKPSAKDLLASMDAATKAEFLKLFAQSLGMKAA